MNTKYKIVLIGASGVGKTSIMNRIISNIFYVNNDSTLGSSYFNLNKTKCVMQIWDTAGQERYKSLIPFYLKNCDAVILVYNLTDKNNIDLHYWINFVNEYYLHSDNKPLLYLIGNKLDLLPNSDPESYENNVNKNILINDIKINIPIIGHELTSAKTGTNIYKIFDFLEEQLEEYNKIKNKNKINDKESIVLDNIEQQSYTRLFLGKICNYL